MNKPIISVVLGSYNRLPYLKLTIKSLREELARLHIKSEIIVVDGGSDDGAINWLIQQKDIITIVQHNRAVWMGKPIERKSWGYFMNLAFKAAQGKYICMISDDCLIIPHAFVNAYKLFEERLNEGLRIGGVAFYFRNWPEDKAYYVNYTIDNTMMINHGLFLKKALEDVNYIDEDNYFFYHADDDLALKLKQAGYNILDASDSFIEHFLHANTVLRAHVYESERKDYYALIDKWHNVFDFNEDDGIHAQKKRLYDYKHSELDSFQKLYKKEISKIRFKNKLFLFKKNLKLLFEPLYWFKYVFVMSYLMIMDRKKFKQKWTKTKEKYFK